MDAALFLATFMKIGLLFILQSGHTVLQPRAQLYF